MTAPLAVTLLAEAWPHIFRDPEQSCIAATRVGGSVLDRLRVPWRPLPCAAWAGNRPAVRALAERRPLPIDGWTVGIDPDASHLPPELPPEGYSEPFRRTGGWAGHLVIVGDGWLLDLAAAQFARPQRGIFVPGPVLVDPAPTGERVAAQLPHDGALLWFPRPELARWRRAPGWRKDQSRDVDRIASWLAAELDARQQLAEEQGT